jgi:hypothetical protein
MVWFRLQPVSAKGVGFYLTVKRNMVIEGRKQKEAANAANER